MTVWQLWRALTGYLMRGRARQRIYVVPGPGVSDATQADFDARVWTILDTYTPYTRQDRFVLVTAQPQRPRNR